ncbi:MAG: DUF4317 domain-containing protein [Oscillospiraceae bacterium]|nr:DUF4317 domain-containing protein [Oscillospiraceae bacterium]
MNQKELNEIRRRLALDKNCMGKIYGCFVNQTKEIIAYIEEPVAAMPQSEGERYMALFKKALSGTLGKNLIDIEFATQQVMEGEEHKLLMDIRADIGNAELREKLYQKIIPAVNLDCNYVILLGADRYDVPFKGTDELTVEDASETVFSYFVCSVCPVNESKTELGYVIDQSAFHNCTFPQTVAAPEMGFMFPCFDDRAANIYNALFYTKDTDMMQEEFISSVFKTEIPMSAGEQKMTFQEVLTETLEEDCSFEVIQSVHERICERIVEHKESKDPAPLDLSGREVGEILENSGVPKEKVEVFKEKVKKQFGEDKPLKPANIIDSKKFEVVTPQVKISVAPEYSYLLETQTINGRKYIMIPADETVEINGVSVKVEQ